MWFTVTALNPLVFSAAKAVAFDAIVATTARLLTSCLRVILPRSKSSSSFAIMLSMSPPQASSRSRNSHRDTLSLLDIDLQPPGGFVRTGHPEAIRNWSHRVALASYSQTVFYFLSPGSSLVSARSSRRLFPGKRQSRRAGYEGRNQLPGVLAPRT